MSDPVLIAVITALGALATAVVVEIIRRERMHRANEHKLNALVYETSPNSGKSMKDAVDRIEAKVDRIDERQRRLGERVSAVETGLGYLRGRP